eukprot:929607-Amphidinium_carterae.1
MPLFSSKQRLDCFVNTQAGNNPPQSTHEVQRTHPDERHHCVATTPIKHLITALLRHYKPLLNFAVF